MFGHSLAEVFLFLAIVVVCMCIDIHAHRKDNPVSARDAAIWSTIWVCLAFAFAGYVGWAKGSDYAQLFVAGYLLEESLSVDNLFVMMAIFASFGIKDAYQHRVLFYGILGAVILRLLFVAVGSSLVSLFGPYALAGFGVFVLWTAWKMFQAMGKDEEEEVDYSAHWSVRWTRKLIPVHPHLHGHDFFVRVDEDGQPAGSPNGAAAAGTGKTCWKVTPLFLCLVVIDIVDIMFAFDSVPAVIAITPDPFIVYTSNIFAILGLRSMFFLLSAAKRYLRHLEKSVIAILTYIGVKMLLDVTGLIHLPSIISLSVVIGLLLIGVLASFLPEKK